MFLLVKANYRNDPRGLTYRAGQTIEVDDALGSYLRQDSPGSFEPKAQVHEAGVDIPPRDQMVKDAPQKRSAQTAEEFLEDAKSREKGKKR